MSLINLYYVFLLALFFAQGASASCAYDEDITTLGANVYSYYPDAKESQQKFKKNIYLIVVKNFDRSKVMVRMPKTSQITLYAIYTEHGHGEYTAEWKHSFSEVYYNAPKHAVVQKEGFISLNGRQFFIHSPKVSADGKLQELSFLETGFNPFKKRFSVSGERFYELQSVDQKCRILTLFFNDYLFMKKYNEAQYRKSIDAQDDY